MQFTVYLITYLGKLSNELASYYLVLHISHLIQMFYMTDSCIWAISDVSCYRQLRQLQYLRVRGDLISIYFREHSKHTFSLHIFILDNIG